MYAGLHSRPIGRCTSAPRRIRVVVSLAALVAGIAQPSAAASNGLELAWSGGPTCPSGAEVERRVERILERPIEVREGEHLRVDATVLAPEPGAPEPGAPQPGAPQPGAPQPGAPWRVELDIDTGRRRAGRALQAASCDELANATALVIAILLEPSVEQQTDDAQPPAGDAVPPSEPPPNVADAAEPEPRPPLAPQRDPVRVGVGAFASAVSAVLPTWSGGAGVDAVVGWKALETHIAGTFFLPVEQQAPDNQNQGARFQLISAHAELGLRQHFLPQLSAGAFAGAQLAFLHAEGFGTGVTANAQDATFAVISAGGVVTWEATRHWNLAVDADALFPVGDRRFVFSGSDPTAIHTPSWGVQLAVGVQYFFGGADSSDAGPYGSR